MNYRYPDLLGCDSVTKTLNLFLASAASFSTCNTTLDLELVKIVYNWNKCHTIMRILSKWNDKVLWWFESLNLFHLKLALAENWFLNIPPPPPHTHTEISKFMYMVIITDKTFLKTNKVRDFN